MINFLKGFSSAFKIFPTRMPRIKLNDNRTDAEKLAHDWANVEKDIQSVINNSNWMDTEDILKR